MKRAIDTADGLVHLAVTGGAIRLELPPGDGSILLGATEARELAEVLRRMADQLDDPEPGGGTVAQ